MFAVGKVADCWLLPVNITGRGAFDRFCVRCSEELNAEGSVFAVDWRLNKLCIELLLDERRVAARTAIRFPSATRVCLQRKHSAKRRPIRDQFYRQTNKLKNTSLFMFRRKTCATRTPFLQPRVRREGGEAGPRKSGAQEKRTNCVFLDYYLPAARELYLTSIPFHVRQLHLLAPHRRLQATQNPYSTNSHDKYLIWMMERKHCRRKIVS